MNGFSDNSEQGRTFIYAVLFLFFIQLVTEFIEAVYAYGLLGTSIPVEIISIICFLSPVTLVLFGRRLTGKGLFLLAGLILVSRLIIPLLNPRGRMLVSGFGVACFLIFLPLLLWQLGREKRQVAWQSFGMALVAAIGSGVLLRALNSGSDLSLNGWGQLIGWLLAIITATLLVAWLLDPIPRDEPSHPDGSRKLGRLYGLSVGVMGVFLLLHLALSSPNVIARWTGVSYLSVLGIFALSMSLFSVSLAWRPLWIGSLSKVVILAWNALFTASLVLSILPHQLAFPAQPSGYPFFEPAVGFISYISVYLMLLLSPIVIVDFMLYTREIISLQPGSRQLGGGFLIASTIYLLIALAHVFTTVYAYIPVVGPYFRDRFWAVYLAAGLALALPVLLVRRSAQPQTGSRQPGLGAVLVGIFAAACAGGLLVSARSIPVIPPQETVRLLTYNLQQGYNPDGEKNFDGQLDLMREADPEIIALQETDTNRIAGGNADLVRYLADRLRMHSYYGTKTTTGTFGIALLSKYPIQNPRTFYMYSQGEQTATISAQVQVGDETLNIFVTHLGNGGPIVQQEAVLSVIDGLENAIAMGDFNFRPDSDQYRLTTRQMEDAWLLKWPQGIDDQGFDPSERIDHIFVSPGTTVTDARFLTRPESDHPAVYVDIVP